jgi:hypothetical protein
VKWPWRREAGLVESERAQQQGSMELETAKEILAVVFGSRPGEVEEMIQRRPRGEEMDRRERTLGLPRFPG